jgi:folylpolyglutamate synthase/dihydropteroate synthase
VLGWVLYLLYIYDVPQTANTKAAIFADETAVMAVGENIEEATDKLQQAINAVNSWIKQWCIILNEIKSVHVNFTNRRVGYIQVTINGNQIPHSNMAKYLGTMLDAKLRWEEHVKKETEELNIKYRKVKWLLGRTSQLSIQTKY